MAHDNCCYGPRLDVVAYALGLLLTALQYCRHPQRIDSNLGERGVALRGEVCLDRVKASCQGLGFQSVPIKRVSQRILRLGGQLVEACGAHFLGLRSNDVALGGMRELLTRLEDEHVARGLDAGIFDLNRVGPIDAGPHAIDRQAGSALDDEEGRRPVLAENDETRERQRGVDGVLRDGFLHGQRVEHLAGAKEDGVVCPHNVLEALDAGRGLDAPKDVARAMPAVGSSPRGSRCKSAVLQVAGARAAAPSQQQLALVLAAVELDLNH
mmetsp:Transcript_16351/g.51290  ORF Transcript_16351/g.51290 Transcript_16351/m.51290 type:complete len:268 (+) Transcript_16351:2060-2863(+)